VASLQGYAFLMNWPDLASVQRVRKNTLRTFSQRHNCRKASVIDARISQIASARPLTSDPAIVDPLRLSVQTYATQLRVLIHAVQAFDTRIAHVFAHHPDQALFDSFPGAGKVCAPRLSAAFGTDRSRWQSATELQSHSGIAPVTERSGKALWVHHRLACPKFVKQTFHEFADQSIRFSQWARAYYDQQRGAAMIITRRCERSRTNGSGFSFAVGRIANRMMKRRTWKRSVDMDHRSSKIMLDGATQMSMPPAPSSVWIW
jgi:hypothetical protein